LVSSALLAELRRVLAYPKIARIIPAGDAERLVALLGSEAETVPDPGRKPPMAVEDPGDEYLLALAAACGAPLVSGDRHLTVLAGRLPVFTPADFLAALDDAAAGGQGDR